MVTGNDVLTLYKDMNLTEEEATYLNYHAKRLAFAINIIQKYCDQFNVKKILDISPHFLTRCIKELVTSQIKLFTLGYFNYVIVPSDIVDEHIEFDLNNADKIQVEFKNQPFDLIVFAEVIEHLYTAPQIVLSFLKQFLVTPHGGILVQTPNAVSLNRRISMLLGRNPYELIRVDRSNPGHFREYTMQELVEYGQNLGFKIWYNKYCNYWPDERLLVRRLENYFPVFRQGITIVYH